MPNCHLYADTAGECGVTDIATGEDVGTCGDTDGIAAALDAPVTAVPRAAAPLEDAGVAAVYDRLAIATGPNP